jgi:hypothetical protein
VVLSASMICRLAGFARSPYKICCELGACSRGSG